MLRDPFREEIGCCLRYDYEVGVIDMFLFLSLYPLLGRYVRELA